MEITERNHRPSFSIFDASAGSGKTYMLVKEYLKIILTAREHDAYRNILAITFTNKAVNEMKSRILNNLYDFSQHNTSEKSKDLLEDLSRDTGISTIQLQSKAGRIIKHLIHNYASFDILTIDKFTHKIIRAFAHDLKLPINFEVTLDTDLLLSEAVDSVVSLAGEDMLTTDILVDFALEKTDEDKSWDITREIFEISKLLYKENNRENVSALKENNIGDFLAITQRIKTSTRDLESENRVLGEAALKIIFDKGIDPKSFSYETFPNHLRSISRGENNIAKNKFHEISAIKVNKAVVDRDLINQVMPEILDILTKVYANCERIELYKAFLKNATPLSLLNTISNALGKIQQDQNVLSIAEFNTLIHNYIQGEPALFIYERLGEKYHHFFIDEFQDTSETQWNNLTPLIDNALSSELKPGTKGTLMIVGDPKQSIYRWRGGKAEQFIELAKKSSPFNNPDKKLFHLTTNFRSYSEIIEFNNDFFQYLSGEFSNPDYKDLYENHSRQLATSKVGGYVNITLLDSKIENDSNFNADEDEDRRAVYCKVTLNKINEILSNGYNYRDIAILTRKKAQGILIAEFLSQRDVPLISSETLLLENSPEVRFIVNVLAYCSNTNDLEAKANFLYYLGASGMHNLGTHEFISAGMKIVDQLDFEKWLSTFDISVKFKELRRKSLYEVIEQLLLSFFRNNPCDVYIQSFLDLAFEQSFHKQAGIADFLAFWKENSSRYSIPSPEGTNAVRILTVHKSKGLEFKVVIIPFAEENYEKSPKEKIWIEDINREFGLPKILVDNNKSLENFGDEARETYKKHKEEELLDNVNVLYVALTRAEEQLYIISSRIRPKKDGDYPHNMASFFVKYLSNKGDFEEEKTDYFFGSNNRISADEIALREGNDIPNVQAKFNPKKIRIAQRDSFLWGTAKQFAIDYGNLIHEILARIVNKDDFELAIESALAEGLISTEQEGIVSRTINEIVNHKELELYFVGVIKVFNEQAIVQKTGGILIPDRIVIRENNEVYILDYKTGVHHDKYRLQLESYQKVLEEMKYIVKAKTLVYIGEKIDLVQL